MIGCGLALNDTGFILVQAMCPTSSLSRSVTLFLSPDARSLQWGYKREGERWGVQEVRSGSGRKGRERQELRYELSVQACACGSNLTVLWLCTSELDRSNESVSPSMLGESASPFIDEGDGITSERERVCMLLSLAAHAGGYKMIVGVHNTVECQMHVGGCVVLFRYGRCRYLLYC